MAVFGTSLDRVDQRLIHIAELDHEDGFPEWLYGISKVSQLPRFQHLRAGTNLGTIGFRPPELAARLYWIVENLSGAWCLNTGGLYFARVKDAVHYRLYYGGTMDGAS